jgi:hypothetical protein
MMNKEPRGFRLPLRALKAGMVDALVVSCEPELGRAWVRDEQGVQYALCDSTSGVRLSGLRVGNQLKCEVASDGYSVMSARRVRRAYPEPRPL